MIPLSSLKTYNTCSFHLYPCINKDSDTDSDCQLVDGRGLCIVLPSDIPSTADHLAKTVMQCKFLPCVFSFGLSVASAAPLRRPRAALPVAGDFCATGSSVFFGWRALRPLVGDTSTAEAQICNHKIAIHSVHFLKVLFTCSLN